MSVRWWQERLYPDPQTRDPHLQFLNCLGRYIQPTDAVLDVGAGAGLLNPYALKGKVQKIIGVDLCPEVVHNPLLDVGVVADVQNLPLEDQSVNVAFSIFVLEHLEDPGRFVREIRRVLKPGGYFLALTPNRFHYVTLISALTPTQFHKWFNERRGRKEEDTFPTYYRLNSRRAQAKHFRKAGFEVVEMTLLEVQPNYLMFSTPTFLLGAAYERVVNATELLSGLRVGIMSVFQKREEGAAPVLANQRGARSLEGVRPGTI